MIKRILALFIIALLLIPQATVYADVIFGNEFLFEHADKTKRITKNEFIANGPNGYVSAKKEPGSDEEVYMYENGEVIILSRTYLHKGEYWGTWLYHGSAVDGWVLMNQVLVAYSLYDFIDENRNKFYTYTGNYDAVLSADKLVIWQWPGSDREKKVVDNPSYYANYHSSYMSKYTYKDSEGREWAYAYLDGWFSLSDPENKTNIPAFNPAPPSEKWSGAGISYWISNITALPKFPFVTFPIVGVAVLIWVLLNKSKRKQRG